jgi:hypothetical protein
MPVEPNGSFQWLSGFEGNGSDLSRLTKTAGDDKFGGLE